MARLEEITDPLVRILTPVPPVQEGVCEICHRAPRTGYTRCVSCAGVLRSVPDPVRLVVPISLYQVGDQLHTVLRGYKDSRIESVRAKFAIQVAAFFGRFIRDHGECIREAAGENWDGLVVVPSSHGREGVHPLAAAIGLISGMELPVVDCLVATGIAVEHNKPAEAAYIATSGAQGRRVLLIDDTYTTGAHLQSAATSLSRAGAQVLAAVVIGRVMDANFNEENARLLRAARRKGFRFDGCCLEPEDG